MGILSRKLTLALLLTTLSLFVLAGPKPGDKEPSKQEVQAAFLYHYTQFVDWPSSAFADESSPVVIGVLGMDPFGDVLDDTLRGKMSRGRPIIVKRAQNITDLLDVHILFIGHSEKRNMKAILQKIGNRPILTVAEMDKFAHSGGMINFVLVKRKVRFEVNPGAGQTVGLKMSSKMLKVGRVVKS